MSIDPYRLSAFGEHRVSSPFALADIIHRYGLDSERLGVYTANGGTVTHVPAQSAARVAVTGASGSEAILSTHEHFRYQAGRGKAVLLTGYWSDAGQSNQRREWGEFDGDNGVFFRIEGTTLYTVVRSSTSGSPVDDARASYAWNRDRGDGTGDVGVIDVSKGNIWEIRYQWLGVGTVQFFVNGHLVDERAHAGLLTAPYMSTAQNPVRVRVVNTGVSSAASFTSVCFSVSSQSGYEGPRQAFASIVSTTTLATPGRPILGLRVAQTFGGLANRSVLLPEELIFSSTSADARISVVMNPTITGGTWAAPATGSAAEVALDITSISGGTTVYALDTGGVEVSKIELTRIFSRLARKLVRRDLPTVSLDSIVLMAASSPSRPARASLEWSEIQ